ncbi:TetR family transcriptional regulator [Janibacter sp. GXQ6167]|uniref:TetR family transcriptional regulator n=1 Tax=Janibacter sp. GXQ6167 TaxID=3240791 RepID=UPI0035244377
MSTPTDGRSARWEVHRQARRAELVESAIRAIREQGATVGMDDIAAAAGTSKTVFYRHFHDRFGLYRAIAERVDQLIMRDITSAVGGAGAEGAPPSIAERMVARDPQELISGAISAYLRLVERDPEVYRFIVSAPIVEKSAHAVDVAVCVTGQMAGQVGALISEALIASGSEVTRAQIWGQSLVGMVRAAADTWLAGAAGTMSREALTQHLADLAWSGLAAAWPPSDPAQPHP